MAWEALSEEIDFVIPLPIPTETLPPHRHTNSFLVGRREMGLVDAGLWDEEALEGLVRFIRSVPGGRLAWLLLTHWHPDHGVGADRIREETGCRIGIHGLERDRVLPLAVDFTFGHGDRFEVDGETLEAIHTPGHSPGHTCFLLQPGGVLFTGDHILGLGTSIIVPPDGDMHLYMESLSRLLSYPVEVICPGHGPVVWEPAAKIREYIEHRKERERAVLEGVRKGLCRAEELVEKIYTDVPVSFHGMACFSVEAHLIKLCGEGKLRRRASGDGYEPSG